MDDLLQLLQKVTNENLKIKEHSSLCTKIFAVFAFLTQADEYRDLLLEIETSKIFFQLIIDSGKKEFESLDILMVICSALIENKKWIAKLEILNETSAFFGVIVKSLGFISTKPPNRNNNVLMFKIVQFSCTLLVSNILADLLLQAGMGKMLLQISLRGDASCQFCALATIFKYVHLNLFGKFEITEDYVLTLIESFHVTVLQLQNNEIKELFYNQAVDFGCIIYKIGNSKDIFEEHKTTNKYCADVAQRANENDSREKIKNRQKIIDDFFKTASPYIIYAPARKCSNPACTKSENKRGDFKKCSRCKAAFYCSKECQSTDWPKHKNICTDPNNPI